MRCPRLDSVGMLSGSIFEVSLTVCHKIPCINKVLLCIPEFLLFVLLNMFLLQSHVISSCIESYMELQTATAYTTRFNVLFASLSVNYLVPTHS